MELLRTTRPYAEANQLTITRTHIRRGARPGEDWETARVRLMNESVARREAAIERLTAEYYDLFDQLFRMVYGMGPKFPPAEAELRARLAFIRRRAWKRYQVHNLYPVWC